MINNSPSKQLKAALWWVAIVVLLVAAAYQYGVAGLALAAGGVLFWLLLQFTRATSVMKAAARRPRGHVRDAALLHRRLKPGIALLDLIRATGSLGVAASEPHAQPEVFHWTDSSGVRLVCTFDEGRLVHHELTRADTPADGASQP